MMYCSLEILTKSKKDFIVKTSEFTLIEREELSRLLSQGRTLTDIAKLLLKDRTTISREVSCKVMNRNTPRAFGANQDAKRQKSRQGRKRRFIKVSG